MPSGTKVVPVNGGPALDLRPTEVPAEFFTLMDHDLATSTKAVPFAREDGHLLVAVADPEDIAATDDVRFVLAPTPVLFYHADEDLVKSVLVRWGRLAAAAAEGAVVDEIVPEDIVEEDTADDAADDNGSMARLVGQLLDQAVEIGASDIHVEPGEKDIAVRFRVDGVMRLHRTYPHSLHRGLTNRIKILANIDISERRIPQDGRFNRISRGGSIDFRVATTPTAWGTEKCVMRLFNQSRSLKSLEQVGFHPHLVRELERVLTAPNGLVLVTGPTGSGKTTTLYAALTMVATAERNTMAIEDPVEIRFPAITQVQVNDAASLTFATALRAFLRSDPDVILVGEIRDLETAELAIQAAQTGHLVLSTLHTNSAAAVPSRLSALGLPNPADISDTLRAILAQRLLRQVCPECSIPYRPSEEDFVSVGWPQHLPYPTELRQASGTGCPVCNSPDGYAGRLVVGELITVDDEIADLITAGASAREIERVAHAKGTISLHLDALAWLAAGRTTTDELRRIGL